MVYATSNLNTGLRLPVTWLLLLDILAGLPWNRSRQTYQNRNLQHNQQDK